MGLSRTVSVDFSRKLQISHPRVFDAPDDWVIWVPLGTALVSAQWAKQTRMMGLPDGQKF